MKKLNIEVFAEKILEVISASTGFTTEQILSHSRKDDLAIVRMTYIMTIIRLFPDSNVVFLMQIVLKNQDRTAYYFYMRTHENFMNKIMDYDKTALRYRRLMDTLSTIFPSYGEREFSEQPNRYPPIRVTMDNFSCGSILVIAYASMLAKTPTKHLLSGSSVSIPPRVAATNLLHNLFPQVPQVRIAKLIGINRSNIVRLLKQHSSMLSGQKRSFEVIYYRELIIELNNAFSSA